MAATGVVGFFDSEEKIQTLRAMWTAGHTTSAIARHFGVSKNIVIGKSHRLDLEARPSPIRNYTPGAPKPNRLLIPSVPRPVFTLPPLPSETRATERAVLAVVPRAAVPKPVIVVPPVVVQKPLPVSLVPALPWPDAPAFAPRKAFARCATACCWPIGEPRTKAFRYCDDVSVPGKPYCGAHCKLAYVKISARQADAA